MAYGVHSYYQNFMLISNLHSVFYADTNFCGFKFLGIFAVFGKTYFFELKNAQKKIDFSKN
jgi:hypothetical protein